MPHDESTTNGRPRRERSTRYPGVPLSDCVELAKFIEARGLDGLSAPDIASALGYKNIKTNTFSARLSAARQFGLLTLANDGYSLTSLAKAILHPVDPSDLPRLYRQALVEPPIYAELVERLGDKRVPEVAILGNVLYHNHQIIASAKESAAEAFLASARFAGALGDDHVLRLQGQPSPTTVAAPAPPAARPRAEVRIDLRLWGDDEGKVLRVRAPESITAESFERLLQALRLHVRIS
ncbi:MAG TPA: hypothetical protein VGH33_08780 [Isosphaeraceae bacterium]